MAGSAAASKGWRPVVFSADCDEDGNCPVCGIDYAECSCPGPTMDEYDYKEKGGQLLARPKNFFRSRRSCRKS
jgi:hypothetical protein